MGFTEFVRLVARIPDWIADAHFKSQSAMLCPSGQKIPDFIGHYESLDKDWETLSTRYRFPPLQRRNAVPRTDWRSYYTDPSIIHLVAERYNDDLVNFNYMDTYKALLHQYP
jgi:hypothetical protein